MVAPALGCHGLEGESSTPKVVVANLALDIAHAEDGFWNMDPGFLATTPLELMGRRVFPGQLADGQPWARLPEMLARFLPPLAPQSPPRSLAFPIATRLADLNLGVNDIFHRSREEGEALKLWGLPICRREGA